MIIVPPAIFNHMEDDLLDERQKDFEGDMHDVEPPPDQDDDSAVCFTRLGICPFCGQIKEAKNTYPLIVQQEDEDKEEELDREMGEVGFVPMHMNKAPH